MKIEEGKTQGNVIGVSHDGSLKQSSSALLVANKKKLLVMNQTYSCDVHRMARWEGPSASPKKNVQG
jgi:hypothetical protein